MLSFCFSGKSSSAPWHSRSRLPVPREQRERCGLSDSTNTWSAGRPRNRSCILGKGCDKTQGPAESRPFWRGHVRILNSYISFPGSVLRASVSPSMVLGLNLGPSVHILGKCLPTELHSHLLFFFLIFVFAFETGSQHVVRAGLELTEARLALPSECEG